jgi:hypothetical protein
MKARVDAPAQASGRLGLGRPNRGEHGEHQRRVDVGDRHTVQLGAIIVLSLGHLAIGADHLAEQRCAPHCACLVALHLGLDRWQERARRLHEGLGGRCLLTRLELLRDRVSAGEHHAQSGLVRSARVRQLD